MNYNANNFPDDGQKKVIIISIEVVAFIKYQI